jgi:hypothetical protein
MAIHAVEAETLNVDLVLIDFAGLSDFAGVQYSAANNDLPTNNRFYFQESVVKASHI